MTYLSFLAGALAVCVGMVAVPAKAEDWLQDFAAAKKLAHEQHKDLLVNFTGSDWCVWCHRLEKEVFAQEEFRKWADDKFVLAMVDAPRDPSLLLPEIREQNQELIKEFAIKGFPTILLCDADGRPFAATGYQPGGPPAYNRHLEDLRKHKEARDASFQEASEQDGVTKANTLIQALNAMSLSKGMIHSQYPDIAEQIKQSDPADETGFAREQRSDLLLAEFMSRLGEFRSRQDLEGAMQLVEDTLAKGELQGEWRQQVYGHQAGTLASAGKKKEAVAVLKKAVQEAPGGPRTRELEDFIQLLEKEMVQPPAVPTEE